MVVETFSVICSGFQCESQSEVDRVPVFVVCGAIGASSMEKFNKNETCFLIDISVQDTIYYKTND